jgi:hypothetical protein
MRDASIPDEFGAPRAAVLLPGRVLARDGGVAALPRGLSARGRWTVVDWESSVDTSGSRMVPV